MRTLILIAGMLLSVAALQAQANAIDEYFQKYIDDQRFTSVYISGRLMNMIGNMNLEMDDMTEKEFKAFQKVAEGLKGLRILTAEENTDAFYKEAKDKIKTTDYEVLMSVRDTDGQNFEFFVKDAKDGKVSELFLISGGNGNDFVLMSFVGLLDLDSISKMAKDMAK